MAEFMSQMIVYDETLIPDLVLPRMSIIKDRIKDLGPRTKDHGPCFGMNEHPGRDTDVIPRLSKSTIEDLSFYISFTRIGYRILDPVLA